MPIYQHFDRNNGRIIDTMIIPDEIAKKLIAKNYPIIIGTGDSQTHYVDLSKSPVKVKLRPVQPITQDKKQILADGKDVFKLSNLSVPCEITIGTQKYETKENIFEWGTTLPKTYLITVSNFPYLDWESEVTAIENTL